ncbi:hypothetical protein E2562_034621 [Oryza meyeriana var. granulata]|uniref:Uncharacterized protein n=1 Tax=Oryza meyeriana var. granulata TaxID=110450 RepID=A0A6G1E8L6_9ORYZ|nr:hypothetical protein E2562_034621 [Oryza meyeriana var. granulata]
MRGQPLGLHHHQGGWSSQRVKSQAGSLNQHVLNLAIPMSQARVVARDPNVGDPERPSRSR